MIVPKPPVALMTLLLMVLSSGIAVAEPLAWSVNSRGNEIDSQRVNALWRINLQTGSAEYVGWTSFLDLEGLALHPDGMLYGADDESKTTVQVSRQSGFAQPIGGPLNRQNMGVPLTPNLDFGMAFDCEGQGYVVSDMTQTLFTVNLETGALTAVGPTGSLGAPITDIAIRGSQAFGIGVGTAGGGLPASPNLYAVDLASATSTLIGPLGPQASQYNNAGLDFDAEGRLWAITDRRAVAGNDWPSEILRIDTATGQATRVAETIVGLESLAISVPTGCAPDQGGDDPNDEGPVPIPTLGNAALALLALLLGLLAASRLWLTRA
ncbi:MAG: IPTL-CTERM sorting domain-containing protein [Wenzhouxiangella sp.]